MALANSAAYSAAAANPNLAAAGAKVAYIPPFRPLPVIGDGPVEALNASVGAAVDRHGAPAAHDDAEDAPGDSGGGEDSPSGGGGDRLPGPPDPRFRAPSEAFAALIEFAEAMSAEHPAGGFTGAARIKKAAAFYEMIQQLIRGVLYRPGAQISISL